MNPIKTRADCIAEALRLASAVPESDADWDAYARLTDRIQALCALAALLPEDRADVVPSADAADLPDPRLGEVVDTVWGPARWYRVGVGWRLVPDHHDRINGSVGRTLDSEWWAWDGTDCMATTIGHSEAGTFTDAITAALDCLRTAGKLR